MRRGSPAAKASPSARQPRKSASVSRPDLAETVPATVPVMIVFVCVAAEWISAPTAVALASNLFLVSLLAPGPAAALLEIHDLLSLQAIFPIREKLFYY